MRLVPLTALVLSLGAVACGGDSGDSGGDTSAVALAASDDGDGSGAGGLSTTVTLTGGRHAGTHRRESREGGCIDYMQLGLGAADFSPDTQGLTAVDFGVKNKSGQGTDDFGMTLTFADGDIMTTDHYRIDPRKQQGTGTARITGTGPRYTIQVTGKTADGVGVEATIRCLG